MTQPKRKPARKPRRPRPVPLPRHATWLLLGYFTAALALMWSGRAWWVAIAVSGGATMLARVATQ